jgi:hypothetical protein
VQGGLKNDPSREKIAILRPQDCLGGVFGELIGREGLADWLRLDRLVFDTGPSRAFLHSSLMVVIKCRILYPGLPQLDIL